MNDTDIRRFHPKDYHRHITAVMQDFSRYNFTLAENVGFGYIDKLRCDKSVRTAVHLADADTIVDALPNGMDTQLETPGFEPLAWSPVGGDFHKNPGLSGGQVWTTYSAS